MTGDDAGVFHHAGERSAGTIYELVALSGVVHDQASYSNSACHSALRSDVPTRRSRLRRCSSAERWRLRGNGLGWSHVWAARLSWTPKESITGQPLVFMALNTLRDSRASVLYSWPGHGS